MAAGARIPEQQSSLPRESARGGKSKAALAAAIDVDADADASGLAKEEENRTQSLEQDREEKSCKQQRMLCSLVFFNSMTFGCHHVRRPSVISIPGMLAT